MSKNTLKLNSGRQEPRYAEFVLNFADAITTVSGQAAKAIWLPEGAVLHTFEFVTEVAFNSATSDTLLATFDSDSSTILAATSIAAIGRAAAAASTLGQERSAQDYINLTWTGVGAVPTAGKVRVFAEYTLEGVEHYNNGKDGLPPGIS